MGVEEEIAHHLAEGASPAELIDQGYRKSTVYKIASRDRSTLEVVTRTAWHVNLSPNLSTTYAAPGKSIALVPTIQNTSTTTLFVTRWGIMPAWLISQNAWWSQDEEFALAPGQSRRLKSLNLPVPPDLPYDEYELVFGAHISGVDPVTRAILPSSIQWASPPLLLRVQLRPTGKSVFVSHSVADLPDVRRIARYLENHGIEAIIAEDEPDPGVLLDVADGGKFAREIDRSAVVLVVLTKEASESEWVQKEINYALGKGKPLIVMKEAQLKISWSREYIEFSRSESQPQLMARIYNYISKKIQAEPQLGLIAGILGAALVFGVGVMAGMALANSGAAQEDPSTTK